MVSFVGWVLLSLHVRDTCLHSGSWLLSGLEFWLCQTQATSPFTTSKSLTTQLPWQQTHVRRAHKLASEAGSGYQVPRQPLIWFAEHFDVKDFRNLGDCAQADFVAYERLAQIGLIICYATACKAAWPFAPCHSQIILVQNPPSARCSRLSSRFRCLCSALPWCHGALPCTCTWTPPTLRAPKTWNLTFSAVGIRSVTCPHSGMLPNGCDVLFRCFGKMYRTRVFPPGCQIDVGCAEQPLVALRIRWGDGHTGPSTGVSGNGTTRGARLFPPRGRVVVVRGSCIVRFVFSAQSTGRTNLSSDVVLRKGL